MSCFQVDFAKVLHYVGAGVAFPSSMLFVCLQSGLTYRLAKTQEEYWVGHLRVGMALLALIALVLSILLLQRGPETLREVVGCPGYVCRLCEAPPAGAAVVVPTQTVTVQTWSLQRHEGIKQDFRSVTKNSTNLL